MTRASTASLVALLVLGAFAASVAAPGAAPLAYVVGFRELPAERAHYPGDPVADVNEAARFLVVHTDNPDALRARAGEDADVRYAIADEEAVHASFVPNDPYFAPYQYDLQASTTGIDAAWDHSTGSASVRLCVVDTGQQRSHEDLRGLTYYFWTDAVRGKAKAYDDHGHGTHVTGTAAAALDNGKGIAGIAPGVSLGGAKVLNKAGSGTWSQVANGITRCADAGSHVISLSLGASTGAQPLLDAVLYAQGKGALLVAAAGNDGPCADCVSFPAAYPGVLAVACSDQANAFCGFSSEGPEIDLIAPGKDIVSTWADVRPCTKRTADACYVRASGTSMSTPHVSGLAALHWSTHPLAAAGEVEAALKAGARDLGLPAERQGAGLIQGAVV